MPYKFRGNAYRGLMPPGKIDKAGPYSIAAMTKCRNIALAFFMPARHDLTSIVVLCELSRNATGMKKGKQDAAVHR